MNGDDPDDLDFDATEPDYGDGVNAADPESVDRQKLEAEARQREGDQFWRGVFASDIGRREMWAVLQAGYLRGDRFGSGPNGFPHPEATWFRAGSQDFAQRLLDSWQIKDYEGVYVMLCEHDPRFAKAKLPPSRGAR